MVFLMSDAALHALRRFGFGRRGMEPLPDQPRDWLVAQLTASDPWLDAPQFSTANGILVGRGYDDAQKANAQKADVQKADARKAGAHADYGLADVYGDEVSMLLRHASVTGLPVRERLVWFWSNHFSVSARAGGWVFGLIGAYVQEAIRPHVTGRFVDLLKAVMRHPAMLIYLDNSISVGPHSQVGRVSQSGINENLARECLELHTLGVHGGYSQHDVAVFAKILTGRGVDLDSDTPGYVFRPDRHEPGAKMFLNHRIEEGLAGSEAALDIIASHPATLNHVATKLVRHFVADDPPPNCVARVARVLAETDGDLSQAMLAIFDMPEAWLPFTKFRAPAEYMVAVQRALNLPLSLGQQLRAATYDLGQHFMAAPLPNGWPDTAADWVSGDGILRRADWAMTMAAREGAPPPAIVALATLGRACSTATQAAMARCPNPPEALATLLVSPEFLRR